MKTDPQWGPLLDQRPTTPEGVSKERHAYITGPVACGAIAWKDKYTRPSLSHLVGAAAALVALYHKLVWRATLHINS